MSDSVRPFRWTLQKRLSLLLLADGEKSNLEIAAACGTSDRQLRRWIQHPEFAESLRLARAELDAAVLTFAIAQRRKRVARANRDWLKLQRVIDARASDPEMADVPGGDTGLLLHRERAIGTGKQQTVIDEYEIDTGLLRMMLEHERQAAQELGQWTEKREQKLDASEAFINALREFGRGRAPG